MIRKLLRTLGAVKTSIFITILAVLSSVLLYIGTTIFSIDFSPTGIILSTLLPAIVAPPLSYFLLKLLIKLDIAELAMAKINNELEERVKHRTAELIKANYNLKAEINVRKRAEKRIQASLKEKEVLLKEIHHRVKNNLQIVDSLLNLQDGNVEDAVSASLLKTSQNRIRSMALIHEKLYQSSSLSEISFSEYIRVLTSHLFQSYGVDNNRVNLNTNLENICLDIDAAIQCGLIINELVSNSLKHGFPADRKGEIRIDFQADSDKRIRLNVSDNGVGISGNLNLKKTNTLGLQLITNLTNQLDGKLELVQCGGTCFRISFPRNQ